MKVTLTRSEVLEAIGRAAAQKLGWGWRSRVVVKGLYDLGSVDADVRDGAESGVLLERTLPELSDNELHYRQCLSYGCEQCLVATLERVGPMSSYRGSKE